MIYLVVPETIANIEDECRVFTSYSAMEQAMKSLPERSHYVLAYYGEDEMKLRFVYVLVEGQLQRFNP